MADSSDRVTYQVVGLKDLRVELGLNKSELGRLAGVSARTVASAERDIGVREETANRVVEALKKRREEIGKPIKEIEIRPVAKPKKKKKKKDEI